MRQFTIAEAAVISLLLKKQTYLLARLIKLDVLVANAKESLMRKGIVEIYRGEIRLTDTPEVQTLRNLPSVPPNDLPLTVEFLTGKFLKINNKLVPLLTAKTLSNIKIFADRHNKSDEVMAKAFKFYYDRTTAVTKIEEKTVYLKCKSPNTLMNNKELMDSLMYVNPKTYSKWR